MIYKTALITTTINVPTVLGHYRRLGPHVMFFIAGDRKTPDTEVTRFLHDIPNHAYYGIDWQHKLGYKCSRLLGENNDSRRNIALLEAVKWGADIIVSVDDDMIPLTDDFFSRIEQTLTQPFSGLQLGDDGYWVNSGAFTIPPVRQRGLPLDFTELNCFSSVHNAQIGAMQGSILGVADTDAARALTSNTTVLGVTDILRSGFVVNPRSLAVFNSQFVAFRRELAPCFAQFYLWQGRNTDIFASLVMRRVMREMNLHTYFGPPLGFHARTARDLKKDLKAEMFGIEHVQDFASILEHMPRFAVDKSYTRQIYEHMKNVLWFPDANREAALAFLDDMDSVL